MLTHLHIQNYTLIDHLDIDFENGFSVITGETGAGKSIILGAIGLLLGQRADSKSIKTGESRCIIEAEFQIKQYDLEKFFKENDLDYDNGVCIIRRELTSTGKSRAFINDTPASVSQLKELGDSLIDIHSQHQNLLLNRKDFQLQVLDALSTNHDLTDKYHLIYREYRLLQKELDNLRQTTKSNREEQDYLQFLYNQLEEAKLQAGEQEELEQHQQTLEHAEEIKTTLFQSYNLMQGDEQGVLQQIHEIQRQINNISEVYPKAEDISQRIESCYIELKDIVDEIGNNAESIEYDPQQLNQISERLSVIYNLQQKHHVESVQALLDIQHDIEQKLFGIENKDERMKELEKSVSEHKDELVLLAKGITEQRKKSAQILISDMCKRLQCLGMPNIRFEVDITPTNALEPTGADNVQFLFSANKNIPLQPVAHIASGGEIARVMLSLKATLSKAIMLPTIIFDEIDTGVSGHIAESMAYVMQEITEQEQRQVISITHLPQIAAMGSHHYKVYKIESDKGTTSNIVKLNDNERVEEIAHMLSGSTISQAAIDNARSLLSHEDKR